jgi:hypothetical protein
MQSRAELEERTNMKLLERLGTNFALRAAPAFSTTDAPESRAIAELQDRTPGGSADAATSGLVGSVYVGNYYHNKNPDPSQTPAPTKTDTATGPEIAEYV